jgi:hypothetical protein
MTGCNRPDNVQRPTLVPRPGSRCPARGRPPGVLPPVSTAEVPPESPEASLANAALTIEAMHTGRDGDIELMFQYDPLSHPDLALTLKRIDRALEHCPSAIDHLFSCGCFPFIAWVVRVYAESPIVLDALACSNAILVSNHSEDAYQLFCDLLWLAHSEFIEIAENSLTVLTRTFPAHPEWRADVVENSELMLHVSGHLSIDKERLLSSTFKFLRAAVFFAMEDPTLRRHFGTDYLGELASRTLDLCRHIRPWLLDCLNLLYVLCLDEVTFDLAVQHGLERRVLELMGRVPRQCIRVLYRIICQIIATQQRFHCESLLTRDSNFFSRTAALIRMISGRAEGGIAPEKTLKHILRAVDLLAGTFPEQFLRHGVIRACCDLAEGLDMRNAKTICLTMSGLLENASLDIRRAIASPMLLGVMARILDSDEAETVARISAVLRGLHLTDSEHFAALYWQIGLPQILEGLCESEDEKIAECAVQCLQMFESSGVGP